MVTPRVVPHVIWRLTGLLIFILALEPALVSAATYRCAGAEGAVLFTQFGCPDGSEPLIRKGFPADGSGFLSIIDSAELSAEERRALAALRADLDRDRRDRERHREKQAKVRKRERQAAIERCATALTRLDDLQDSRRKGYSAAEDRRWDVEESRWRAVRRADC